MANRKDDKAPKRSTSSTRGGGARRGALGDEPRTSASPASESERDEYTGPSTQPVSEGLEGAIFSDAGSGDENREDRPANRPKRDDRARPARAKGKGRRTR